MTPPPHPPAARTEAERTSIGFVFCLLFVTYCALGSVYLYVVFSGFKPPYPSNLIMSALFIAYGLVLRLWYTATPQQPADAGEEG